MNADDSGGMEFLESMLAMMAVALVLAAFLGMAAGLAADEGDPAEGLDEARFTGTVEGGVFVEGFSGYLEGYIASRGLSGAAVSVAVPGGFCGPATYGYGSMDGPLRSVSFMSSASDDMGRTFAVSYEVVLCGRGTAVSSR